MYVYVYGCVYMEMAIMTARMMSSCDVHVCMHVSVYAYIYIYIYICVYVYVYGDGNHDCQYVVLLWCLCMYVSVCAYMYACMYMYMEDCEDDVLL